MVDHLTEGDEARITRDLPADSIGDNRAADYVSAQESENGDPFYWGNFGGGMGNVWFPADAVELVRSASEMASRKLPSRKELAQQISSSIHGGWGTALTIDETEYEGEGRVLVYGEAENGLRVGFTLTVSDIQETDF